jgi:hypothetical protein
VLAGVASYLFVAVAGLGFETARDELLKGFAQIFGGSEKFRERFNLIGMLPILILFFAWIAAFAVYVWHVFVK